MKLLVRMFLAVLVLAIGAVIAVPFLLPSGWIAEKVAEQVRAQTGRTLTFSDDTSLSFYPDIALVLRNAKLSNPPDMPDGFVVAMDTLRLKVGLEPLISRKVDVKEFVLQKPVVNLLVTGDGKSNWRFGEAVASPAPADGTTNETVDSLKPTEFALGPIKIVEGRLRYLDERTATALKADAINAEISLPRLDGPVEINGDLVWNGEKISLGLKADTPAALADDGRTRAALTVSARPVSMSFSGQMSLTRGVRLGGDVNIKTPSLRGLAKWVRSPLAPGKGLGAFSAKGALAYGDSTIGLKNATIHLDGMKIVGDTTISLKGQRPRVTARVGVDQVNVNAYTAGGSGSGGGAGGGGWSTTPIDLSGLQAVDADIALNTGRIVFGKTTLSKVSARLKLNAGVLDATLNKMTLYGGSAAGALRLNGARSVPSIAGSLRTNGVNAYPLLRDFAGFEWLEGATAITAQISASGRSQAAWVSTLGGTFSIKFTNGAIRGYNIAKMIRGATKNILDGWKSEPSEKTDFSELSASYAIKQGIARNNDLKLIGPLVRLSGHGIVSLPPKTLNYLISPKLVASLQGQGGAQDLTGLEVPFKIKGPWSNPQIYPDIEGILQNPEAAFKTLDGILQGQAGLKNVKTKELVNKIEKKTVKKVTKEVEKVLGEEKTKELEDLGKGLLKNLFKNN